MGSHLHVLVPSHGAKYGAPVRVYAHVDGDAAGQFDVHHSTPQLLLAPDMRELGVRARHRHRYADPSGVAYVHLRLCRHLCRLSVAGVSWGGEVEVKGEGTE